jgi:hypothetical protein
MMMIMMMFLVITATTCSFGSNKLMVAEGLSSPSKISLSTKSRIPNQSPTDVHSFLATPANWPKIVASSVAVEGVEGKKGSSSVQRPFRVGDAVDEIFGLPPILPLSVRWTCTKSVLPRGKNKPGRLEFDSTDGLNGVASDCRMVFDIIMDDENDREDSSVLVNLAMEYKPVSPLAILAIPVLTLDNAFALKVLLPRNFRGKETQLSDLDKFRQLMGNLYGVAGLAHLADCTVGPSQLLTMSGAPSFFMLPPEGQAFALLWCFMGPISFACSQVGGRFADAGLFLYGLVEVVGAGLIASSFTATDSTVAMDPFANAALVQGIVAMAWVYSSQKRESVNE